MIPEFKEIILEDENIIQSSKTYKIDFANKRITTNIDGLDSVKQSIHKILQSERYEHLIYGENYGIELGRLMGQDINFVSADIERTITDALLADNRVIEISEFKSEKLKGDSIKVEFTISTIFGNITMGSEINI
ncbi:MAG: DUF2634 domain-containing protein [Clostridium sp.]